MVLIVDASSAVGGRVATTEEIGIVAGTGRQDSLEFQLLDPMADVRVGDALVTFGSKGGRPYAPGLPIGEVVDVSGAAGQLTRVATVRPFADVSQLSIVGVVTKPPREDPRDSVLPRSDSLPTAAPSPAPLGGVGQRGHGARGGDRGDAQGGQGVRRGDACPRDGDPGHPAARRSPVHGGDG